MIKTLAIETSCDDTSLGIITFDSKVFAVEKLLAYSQVSDHQQYGGVVPEIASRLHSEKIIEVLENIGWDSIGKVDFISMTTHPGLPGALVVAKAVGSTLGKYFDKPLVAVNHIYGHIFSLFLERNMNDIQFPLVVLTASGGHNDIYVVRPHLTSPLRGGTRSPLEGDLEGHTFGNYYITKIGHTLDDASGECFDKVARMLGGPYPGGQWISEKAGKYVKGVKSVKGEKDLDIFFKRIFLSRDKFEFSFSGMKSQVSNFLKKLEKEGIQLNEELVCEIAYEFQEAVVEVLAKKLIRAGIKYGAKTLGIAGGVSCNERLWEYLNEQIIMNNEKGKMESVKVLKPVKKVYSTDNAAMIGVAGIIDRK